MAGPLLKTLREQRFLERLRDKDASLWSDDAREQALIRERLGWVDLHETMQERLAELNEFTEWVRENDFQWAVLLGMGGSSLAPEVLARAFGPRNGYPELIVLDTTDPEAILRVENRINMVATLFIVSSKSGTTIETASLHRYFAERMQDVTGETGALLNFIAVTDPGTVLQTLAEAEGFHRVFLNPPDIGGRYSALSLFGLAPAAAIGIDCERLLASAASLEWEEALELGAALGESALGGRDKVTFRIHGGFESFGAWAEQLLAESTGKRGKGVIPIDCEPEAPTHVYAGDRVFVDIDPEDADRIGGIMLPGTNALMDAGHPVIVEDMHDAYDLGGEFLRWEIATAVIGAAVRINPFDEPNVQESKDNTRVVLDQYVRTGELPLSEAAVVDDGASVFVPAGVRVGAGDDVSDVVAGHLRQAAPPQYVAIMAFIPPSEENDRLLARLRAAVRDATTCATTVGYGPRFLHSTGQLHKGGPATGVFLQITCEDDVDLDIPGAKFGFSVLKQAQAAGDLEALQSRKRPAIRVHLEEDVTGNLRRMVEAVEAKLSPRTAAVE
jgi:glucose-6-phosphate isomerase